MLSIAIVDAAGLGMIYCAFQIDDSLRYTEASKSGLVISCRVPKVPTLANNMSISLLNKDSSGEVQNVG